MKLINILKDINYNSFGNLEIDIKGLSYSSKDIHKDFLFFALTGEQFDGHNYIKDAIEKGAKCIVHTKNIDFLEGISYIKVEDSKQAMSKMASNFYFNPQLKLKIIGITGTDGKSSSVFFVYQMLKKLNYKAGMFSTVSFDTGLGICPNSLRWSTPSSLDIIKLMNDCVLNNLEYFVLEATSHALSLKTSRLIDIKFLVSGLTFIGHEHLEFHKSWQNYRDDKTNLFRQSQFCILNLDSEFEYVSQFCKNYMTYSIIQKADIYASDIKSDMDGSEFVINFDNKKYKAKINLIAKFNIENILLSIACILKSTCIKMEELLDVLKDIKSPAGRMEFIKNDRCFILIDYAHSPNSFKKLFLLIRSYTKGNLIAVFGSAGQRDVLKRKMQGKIASQYCDIIVLTEEDPRFEDNKKIMQDISMGIDVKSYQIDNRRDAIKKALSIAGKDDTVMILGKGHEQSIIHGSTKIPYDEKSTVLDVLSEL